MKNELSTREKEVVKELSLGKSNEEIAKSLCVSINTVKTHLSRSCKKTKAKNRTELVVKYLNKEL
ncbi:MAG: LuxR C-terminal-related transcriptional regulator [Crocinitomicaceae bacterium]